MLPNFLVIGTQRAATTWMYRCLKKHPEIYLPYKKELHFFNKNYDRGLEWYGSWFKKGSGMKAIGEVTPEYLSDEKSPELIAKYIPDIRLIAILRNPIDRAYSEYCMKLRSGTIKGDFETELAENDIYVYRGLYYKHITRYLDYFHRNQLLILIYEDIVEEPVREIERVFAFLNVNSKFIPDNIFKKYNVGGGEVRNQLINQCFINIRKLFEASRFGSMITEYLRDKGVVGAIHKVNKGSPCSKLKKTTHLAKFFKEDIDRLSTLLKRDLSEWYYLK